MTKDYPIRHFARNEASARNNIIWNACFALGHIDRPDQHIDVDVLLKPSLLQRFYSISKGVACDVWAHFFP